MGNYLDNAKKSWHSIQVLEFVLLFWAITYIISVLYHIFIDGNTFQISETNGFLAAGLQSTAAIVGIVFALSIIAIEHSASNYSATMLEFFKKDPLVWFTAGHGLFTIAFLGATMMFTLNMCILSFIFFFWNLMLLGIYLYYTMDLVNPIALNKKIRDTISSAFKKASKKIEKITEKKKNNSLYQGLDPSMIKATVIGSNKDLLKDVKKYETLLQHVILSAYKKQEYESTEVGLLSYPQIIKDYLKLNPDYYWSDDGFFELIRERIKGYAYDAVKNKDIIFLKQVIDSSVQMGHEMIVIKKMDSPMAYNQPLIHLIYSLGKITGEYISWDENLSDREWEEVLQITRALGKLGFESVTEYGEDSQAGNQILKIGMSAMKKMDTFSCFTCVNESFKIFQKRASFPPNTMLKSDLKKLAEFAALAYRLPQSEFHGNSFFFERSGVNPYEYAKNAIHACQKYLDGETEIIQRAWGIKNLKEHISLIIDFTREISHWSRNDIILKIIIMYLPVSKQLFHEPFTPKEEIKTAISSLMSSDGKGNENLAELSITCIHNQYEDSAIKCIEKIFLISKNMMENDEHGYNSNRAFRELNLVGCYLQLYPNEKILDKMIEIIIEFDELFEAKYNKSSSDELSLDLEGWASPPWEYNYKNINHDLKKQIMHIDNRKKFELCVRETKEKHQKNKSSKNEK